MSQLRSEIKQTRPFGSLAEEVFLNLVRTADHLTALETAFLRDHDITPSQYNVLRILRGAGDNGLPCLEVGARMVSRVPDVTRLLDRIEKAGWIARQRSRDDRRVVVVRILPSGTALLARLDAPMRAFVPRLLGHFGDTQLRTLNRLLVRVRQRPETPAE